MSAPATQSRPSTQNARPLRNERIVERYVRGDLIVAIAAQEGVSHQRKRLVLHEISKYRSTGAREAAL